jgi:transposase
VRKVAERMGGSTKSVYTWQKQYSRPVKVIQDVEAQADEIGRLKRDLARVTDARGSLERRLHNLPWVRYEPPRWFVGHSEGDV